jgi:hypothetical protein
MRPINLSLPRYVLSLTAVFVAFECERALAVGGISNSKVVVPSAGTVPKGRFEVEPFFGFTVVNDAGDTVQFESRGRFTVGVFDNLEIGVSVGYLTVEDSDVMDRESDFGDIEAGLKYRFLDESENLPFSLAYQGGITFPTGGGFAPWVFELVGFILTKDFSEAFSMDADFVITLIEDYSVGLVSEMGFGYFIAPWFQPVIEAAYSLENPDGGDSVHVFNITLGFTAPIGEMLTIIIGITRDLYTDSTDDQIAFSAAFTFLF